MIIIKPLLTEKTLANAQKGIFTFAVSPKSSKHQVKTSIEAQFGVNVTRIHTIKTAARTIRSRKTGKYLKTKPTKKALVNLKAKQTIDLFDVKK